jgi:hypothetical protein
MLSRADLRFVPSAGISGGRTLAGMPLRRDEEAQTESPPVETGPDTRAGERQGEQRPPDAVNTRV